MATDQTTTRATPDRTETLERAIAKELLRPEVLDAAHAFFLSRLEAAAKTEPLDKVRALGRVVDRIETARRKKAAAGG